MSATFANSTLVQRSTSGRSVLRRMFDDMIAARSRHAKRQVNAVLLSMDEKTLTDLGYNRAELIREGVGVHGHF